MPGGPRARARRGPQRWCTKFASDLLTLSVKLKRHELKQCKLAKAALFYSPVDFTDASHWCVHRCIELSTDERNKTTPWWIIPRDICFNVSGVSFCWQFSWLIIIFNSVILSLYLFSCCTSAYRTTAALITAVWSNINQSIDQKRIKVTKVTNVTARPLLQC